MITDLEPYRSMKDPHIPWLGAVPDHWRLERAKWLMRKMDRPVSETDEVITCFRDGIVTLRRNRRVRGFTESLQETGYQGIRSGDLVIHAMDAFAGAVGVADSDGKGTGVYSVCQAQPGVDPHYVAYVVREMARSQWILALATGIRERSTDFRFDTFASQILPLPLLPEQTDIVRFLDHANRRIRGAIRAKQKLIELLNEQTQVVIHRAVTRGLDPDIRLKPSGVDWPGDVPEHWEVRRLKALIERVNQGVSPQAENRLADVNSWGVLKSGCVNRGVFRDTEHKRLPPDFHIDGGIVVRSGDIIVSRASGSPRLVGSTARVHTLRFSLILSDKTFRLIPRSTTNPDFLVLALNSPYYREQVEQSISGAGGLANNLPLSELRSFLFAIPPFTEQGEIVESFRRATENLATASDCAEREIDLLREYRTRLIVDVVTGKLDVREAAASLPDEADKPEPLGEIDLAETDDTDAEVFESVDA